MKSEKNNESDGFINFVKMDLEGRRMPVPTGTLQTHPRKVSQFRLALLVGTQKLSNLLALVNHACHPIYRLHEVPESAFDFRVLRLMTLDVLVQKESLPAFVAAVELLSTLHWFRWCYWGGWGLW